MAEARLENLKQYCIILNTDSKTTRNGINQRNAIAGGIWFLDGPVGPNDGPSSPIVLTSTIDNTRHIQTSRDNVRKISLEEYNYLISLKPELRLKVLGSPIFLDLLKVQIYDKLTVSVIGQHGYVECIVHYIGPVDSKRGYYFGVVFENRVGDTDGTINDKIYFVAKQKHGKFLTIDKIVNISKSKLQQLSSLSSFKSLENLSSRESGPEKKTRRRTKSQNLLLDLPVESGGEHDNIDKRQQSHKHETTRIEKHTTSGLSVDSRVVFYEESGIPLHGTIKFIGFVNKLDDVTLVGLELDGRIKESHGNFKNGIKIFDCPRNKGLIARPEELIKEEDFKLMGKELMGKIIVDMDEPNEFAGDFDANMNVVVKRDKTNNVDKNNRAKSSVDEEHFSCPICLDTVEEAVETTCCHQIFCERCIRKHRDTSCPKCRQKPYTITVSHFVRKLVGNFCMECSNDGCYEIASRSEMRYHKAKCPYENIRCPHDGCKTRVRRDKLEGHKKICGYALVTCPNIGCGLRVSRQGIDEHDKCCDHALITCTNQGCHVTAKRMKLGEHEKASCKFMIVNCPVPNCRFKYIGVKIGEHLTTEHYELFIRHLNDLKNIYSTDEKVGIFTVKWMSPT